MKKYGGRKKVELTKRDFDLLKFIFQYKVCDLSSLGKYIFKNCHESVAKRRLNKLCKIKLVKKVPFVFNRKLRIAYSLLPPALKEISHLLPEEMVRFELGSSSLYHDLQLIHIGERIKTCNLVKFYKSENELRSFESGQTSSIFCQFSQLRSDGMLSLMIDEKEYFVALEYEASEKSVERWQDKLNEYHLRDTIDAVFYICKDQKIRNAMEKVEKDLCQNYSPKIYFILLDDFFMKDQKAIFSNVSGQKFYLNFP